MKDLCNLFVLLTLGTLWTLGRWYEELVYWITSLLILANIFGRLEFRTSACPEFHRLITGAITLTIAQGYLEKSTQLNTFGDFASNSLSVHIYAIGQRYR